MVVVVVVKRTRMMINYKQYVIDFMYIFAKVLFLRSRMFCAIQFWLHCLKTHLTLLFTYMAMWYISQRRGGGEKANWITSKASALKVCFTWVFLPVVFLIAGSFVFSCTISATCFNIITVYNKWVTYVLSEILSLIQCVRKLGVGCFWKQNTQQCPK